MRPPRNSHGFWPFLRPPERVPEVPVVCREHLPQLEKIQGVLYSRRDEGHFRRGFSRLITPNLWNFQRVFHTLAATQEVPRHTRLHSRQGLTPLGDSRSTPRSMSALERNPQVPALTPHKVLGPSIDGRGNPRGPHEAPEELAWVLAFPEATRAGP